MSWSRAWLVYPFLLAVAPVLHMAAANSGQFRPRYLADVLLLVIAAVGIVYGLVLLAVRWRRAPLGACITAVVVIAFFYLVPASDVLDVISWRLSRPSVLLAAWIALGTLLLWRLARRDALESLGRFLALTGLALIAFNAVALGRHVVTAGYVTGNSELARQLAKPIGTTALASNVPAPDIYIVVLDEYASDGVLREQFGYDNSAFQDSLRELGFTIPPMVHANYTQTRLSLASMLNFAHVTSLEDELGPDATDVSLLAYLIENNRTVRFLKRRGYRFVHFPSTWFSATLSNSQADEVYQIPSEMSVRRLLTRSELRRVLWGQSLLRLFGNITAPGDPAHLLGTFRGLEHVRRDGRPLVVFAHVMAPHEPYVLDELCQARPPIFSVDSAPTPETRAAYVAQLECVNALTLRFVRSVLARAARSSRQAVIVLQGDHGTSTTNPFGSPYTLPDVASLRERFGVFGAYYVPGAEREYAKPLTVANVMRNVLASRFGVDAPPVPDKLFYSHYETPFAFTEIERAEIEPALASDSSAGEVEQEPAVPLPIPTEWDERIPLPAFALAEGRDVCDVVPAVPGVHAKHPVERQLSVLGMVERAREVARAERPEEPHPSSVQSVEHRQ
jgi:hypothetical protein